MTDFRDLGLRDELIRLLEDEGYPRATAIQRAVIPVLRRGGNLVARASTGSGRTLAYALGVLDRLGAEAADEAEIRTRMLILRPTPEAARETALAIHPYAQVVGMAVSAAGGGWGTPVDGAEIAIGAPESVLETVRTSVLKLDAVEAVVVDGASAMEELGQLEAVETLLDHLPRDAQRVLITHALTGAVEDLVDRRVKRALRYPHEAAVPETHAGERIDGEVGYIVVPEAQKLELIAGALAAREPDGAPPVLFFRTDERAANVAESLTSRGFALGELDGDDVDVVIAAAGTAREELVAGSESAAAQTISYDVPADEESLLSRHGGDAGAIVLIEPKELPHFREIATRAHLRAQIAALPIDVPEVRGVTAFREELRRALREQDIGAQMLVLEPLFEEFSPAEVAAAATALLRRRPPLAAAQPVAAAPTAAAAPVQRPVPATEAGAPPATWARLFIGLGSRDGIRPGDLVGAIAGEAGIPGSSVGRIEIRDTFSIVEVQAGVADQVIGALNGTTMRGRSIRVDYDRGADRARQTGRRSEGGAQRPGSRRTLVRRPPRHD